MNKICIIAKNKETYFIKRLMKEVGDGAVAFDPWSDVEFPQASLYLVRSTGVYGSDLDLLILKSVFPEKIQNPLDGIKLFRRKDSQYEWFEREDIPLLPWMGLRNQDMINVEKFFRLYPECVVKPLIGQGGWGVEGLNWSSFKNWWKKKKGRDEDYLLQPFLKNEVEYRYFFIKEETPIVLKRSTKSGIAANFKKGGSAEMSTLPDNIKSIVESTVLKSGLFYGAVDLIVRDRDVYVLEINAVPGIEQIESMSGQNLAKCLADKFLKLPSSFLSN